MSWTPEQNARVSALNNQDILLSIFKHLDPEIQITDPPPSLNLRTGYDQKKQNQLQFERTRTLASAARVCRAFLDPALDVLWRSLNDISVFLRITQKLERSSSWTMSGSWVRKKVFLASVLLP